MSISNWTRFKRWFAAIMNIVEHEEAQKLEMEAFDLRVQAANNFTEHQAKRMDALERRANAAEAALAGAKGQIIDLQLKLGIAVKELQSATNALTNHDERVRQMEAMVLKRAGIPIRRA